MMNKNIADCGKLKLKGFTLIEVLVVVGISTFITLSLFALYMAGQRYFVTESARAEAIRDTRYVLSWITRDIKEGIQVISNWGVYTTSTSCLILQVPSLDANGMIIDINNDFDYIIYRLNSQFPNRLERIIDAKDGVSSRVKNIKAINTRANSFHLSSGGVDLSSVADFTKISSIDILLTTKENRLGLNYQETLKTRVNLRNKSL